MVPSLEGYSDWLQETATAGKGGFGTSIEASLLRNALARKRHSRRLTDAVVHNDEADPNVLVLIPPAYLHDWCRSDDPIDYVETRLLPDRGLDNSLTHLQVGIGAYSSRFMDADGTELNSSAELFVQLSDAGMPTNELVSTASDIRPLDAKDARQMYATAAGAAARVVPCVPPDLRRLAEYGQLFTSPEVWKSLRPVLYTYWS